MSDVVIVGAGPTGLMLACELRLAGARVVVLDRLARRGEESRAGGLHARTLEVFDQRGILDRVAARGRMVRAAHFSALWLDMSGSETRHPYLLGILQVELERVLEARAAELGVRVRWSSEVTGLDQDDTGVEVRLAGSAPLRARYLVGCDGGRSTVRKLAGIGFPGTDATMTALLGDVELTDPPGRMIFTERRERGDYSVLDLENFSMGELEGSSWYRVMVSEYDRVPDRNAPVTLDALREALLRVAGTDFGMRAPRWLSRFGDTARQADRYRAGRVFLAGDAAHIHFPAGGQGLTLGLQDAVNLGWKLGQAIRGEASGGLLDSYHDERHPVGERVLTNTRSQTALLRPGAHTGALREVLAGLIRIPEVNRHLVGMITALDVTYPMGEGHPLLGRRVPDLALRVGGGATRVFELLRAARPVLLGLGEPGLAAVAERWWSRVDLVEASHRDQEDSPPGALLIRPDGHVAWTPDGAEPLESALTRWCGPAGEPVLG
ncbi:FAD-dependent monooxygenase [Spirillospora sp. CA-294931]|uniref:FAD-dependent monooxygenase n=1 Tax=Spirillospora sp. CA-294931 TaxID=3240042 RepID=UPI003D93A3D2